MRLAIPLLAALVSGSAAAADGPAIGQTREEFEAAVVRMTEGPGRRMGFGVYPCALTPPLVPGSETFIGRAFSDRLPGGGEPTVTVVAIKDGRVAAWREVDLPGFVNWFTHMVHRCRGDILALGDPKRPNYRYRWDGERFTLLVKRFD
ncbi:MAG TPA: hypothetical protein VEA41_05890 [Salinarimonas sp.]|jgi:hypothetical protein|nr:hypothetical protein [Salinarimonas sp.]